MFNDFKSMKANDGCYPTLKLQPFWLTLIQLKHKFPGRVILSYLYFNLTENSD